MNITNEVAAATCWGRGVGGGGEVGERKGVWKGRGETGGADKWSGLYFPNTYFFPCLALTCLSDAMLRLLPSVTGFNMRIIYTHTKIHTCIHTIHTQILIHMHIYNRSITTGCPSAQYSVQVYILNNTSLSAGIICLYTNSSNLVFKVYYARETLLQ